MRYRIRRALCAALALPLAGCAGAGIPDWDDALYRRVLSEPGDPFSNETASRAPEARPQEPHAPDTSALIGDSLTLDEAVRFAVLSHPDLRRSASAVRAAGGRELQAGLYPNPAFNFEAEALGAEAGEGGETAFLFEQELVTAGKRRKARAVAEADRFIRQAAFRGTEFEVATRVRRAFADASAAAERRAAQRELFDLATDLLDAAEAQVEAGAATEPDRLRAEVVREQAAIDLRTAENESEAAKEALAAALGLDGAFEAELHHDLTSLPELPPREEAVELVLAQNSNIEQARLAIERAGRAHEFAQAQAFPNVTAAAGPRYSDPDNETTLDVGVSVELPLFDRNQGEIAAALAERIGAGAQLGSVRLSLIEAVSEAWSSYESARFSVEQYRDSVIPKAERTLALTREAYRAGKIDYLRLLDAQQTLVRSRIAYIDALASLHKAAAILEGLMQRSAPWRDAINPEDTR